MTDLTDPLPAGVMAEVHRRLDGPYARVSRLSWNGSRMWLKRPEPWRGWRWRLQKGDPARAFEAELSALMRLDGLGVAVPRVLARGPQFLLVADAGPTVETLLSDPATPAATAAQAVEAAARALAGLHRRGGAHGRPYLRDICWDGRRAVLIDLETSRTRGGALRRGRDIVLFLASLMTHERGVALAPPAAAVLRADAGGWRAAGVLVALLAPLAPLARAVHRRRPRDREIAGYLRLIAGWRGL